MSDSPKLPDELPGQPYRIVVELVSSADVRRLEARDDDVLAEVKQLRKENEALRRSFYELLEVFGSIRKKIKINIYLYIDVRGIC